MFKSESLHDIQKQAQDELHDFRRSFTWPSLPYSQISMVNPRKSVFSKKSNQHQHWKFSIGRTLFVRSIIHLNLVLFIQIQSDSWPAFLLANFMYIKMCIYTIATYVYFLPWIKIGQQYYMKMLKWLSVEQLISSS